MKKKVFVFLKVLWFRVLLVTLFSSLEQVDSKLLFSTFGLLGAEWYKWQQIQLIYQNCFCVLNYHSFLIKSRTHSVELRYIANLFLLMLSYVDSVWNILALSINSNKHYGFEWLKFSYVSFCRSYNKGWCACRMIVPNSVLCSPLHLNAFTELWTWIFIFQIIDRWILFAKSCIGTVTFPPCIPNHPYYRL